MFSVMFFSFSVWQLSYTYHIHCALTVCDISVTWSLLEGGKAHCLTRLQYLLCVFHHFFYLQNCNFQNQESIYCLFYKCIKFKYIIILVNMMSNKYKFNCRNYYACITIFKWCNIIRSFCTAGKLL